MSSPRRPSHYPAGLFLALAAALTLARCLVGCGPLSPNVAAAAIEGAAITLCPLDALVPIVGPIAAAACPGEEALLRAALTTVTAGSAPDAASRVALPRAPAVLELQVAVYRRAPRGLVHVGQVAAGAREAVQAALMPGGER